jgi:hypothetical protein
MLIKKTLVPPDPPAKSPQEKTTEERVALCDSLSAVDDCYWLRKFYSSRGEKVEASIIIEISVFVFKFRPKVIHCFL